MKRSIEVVVNDSAKKFDAKLPPALRKHRRTEIGSEVFYWFDEDAFAAAHDLAERARAASLPVSVEAQFHAEDEPLDPDRVYKLFMRTIAKNTKLDLRGLKKSERCSQCGTKYSVLDEKARPRLTVARGEIPRLFAPGSGDGTPFIRADLAEELTKKKQLSGVHLIEVECDQPCFIFTGTNDIGVEMWTKDTERCARCGRFTGDFQQFFPLFEKPKKKAAIYWSSQLSPFVPIVTGALASAFDKAEPKACSFNYCGWFPADVDAARVPEL